MARRGRRGPILAAGVALVAGVVISLSGGASAARAAEPIGVEPTRVTVTPVATPRVIWHGPRNERVVALTFDDGWNARTLRQIYRVLVREDVPATFFVTGIYVQRAPALWRRIAASGFPLANHSYLHRASRGLTPRQAATDLALTREVVEAATGRPMLPAFRPPYGNRSATTDRRAAAAGFPNVVLWDITAGDTDAGATVSSVVREASAGRPGSIVLLHAGPRVTPRALPEIIARYRARGFRFVTLAELLGMARSTAESRPAARDASWARREDTPATVALFSAALLALILVVAAVAGRGGPTPDEGQAATDDAFG